MGIRAPPKIQVSGLDFYVEIRFAGNFNTENILSLVMAFTVGAPFNWKIDISIFIL